MDKVATDKCPACSTQLFGPVKYCPFCGKRVAEEVSPLLPDDVPKRGPIIENLSASNPKENEVTITALATSEEGADIAQVESWIGSDPGHGKGNPIEGIFDSARVHITVSIDISQLKEGEHRLNVRSADIRGVWGDPQTITFTVPKKEEVKPPIPEPPIPEVPIPEVPIHKPHLLRNVIIGASIAVCLIVGYLVIHKDKPDGPKKNQTGGPREIARIVALETLRQGTDLSVTISKLPKLENVLQAAKKLQDISPRYQDQVASAESTISSAQKTRDKYLMAYIGKALELGRYTPEQISYALGIVRNGDLTPREKIVSDLLMEHVNAVRSGTKPNPSKILSNFKNRFTNFVD